ncbi:LAME_0C07690g1_1 [Lachancea meyersii CBS 8951]|uniref:LAME_0C07690g1_1 n=1 Tax=Lachancea meyersii CBS 8951 TaxID=1266667 RepID=A0A1G4J3C0_9SACH|nr:LAME_0C07690g1_1 [Lachancea meyersii CBS 8951]
MGVNGEIEDLIQSSNVLKRKKEDCPEELLEAEIKRVALNDEMEEKDDTEGDLEQSNEGNNAEIAGGIPDIDNETKQLQRTHSNSELENDRDADTKDYIHLRMLCLVKQASMIVGPGGEKISKMKTETNTRINVSDNIRGVPERVIFIRGRCEDVAKVFGLIVRAINDEKAGDSTQNSTPLTLNLLVPHHMMGCVIGRQGSRLREIEELSAAKLMAGPQTLPMSNDRILCVTGVADAIHIATYYVGQTILNHKPSFAAKKCIFYLPSALHSVLVNNYGVSMQHQQQHQYRPGENGKKRLHRIPSYGYAAITTHPAGFAPAVSVNNVRLSDTVTTAPIVPDLTSRLSLIQHEIYIDDNYVGNVIGKRGKHINSIKESTGCSILIDDPVTGSTERKILIRGTPMGSQTAILLINNKIETDKRNKESNEHKEVDPTMSFPG